jgi:hypothetical protein
VRDGPSSERAGDRVTVGDAEQITSPRCARVQGFSLHAGVRGSPGVQTVFTGEFQAASIAIRAEGHSSNEDVFDEGASP